GTARRTRGARGVRGAGRCEAGVLHRDRLEGRSGGRDPRLPVRAVHRRRSGVRLSVAGLRPCRIGAMSGLQRASFRQLLLVALLLVGALLAAASLHGLITLERLIAQSRDGAERAVAATAATQALAERSVAMERAGLARQVVGAIGIALLMAMAFGLWLSRPLKRVVAAIDGLAANRLDQRIEIQGPADVRQLGRSLDELRIRLAEQDADKARFLRQVSHELKTPLAALREGVALLEDGVTGALSEPQREVARILRENTQSLQGRIEDLLRFNAAVFEAQRLQRRRIELRALLERVVDEQRLQSQARQLRVQVAGGPVWVEVDPDKLSTAVGNLLSNAIRFSPVGDTIRLGVSQHADGVHIEVADAGPGVAPADRERVFEPFYRGERQPGDAARGSGIGLSIVQEFVAAHGGHVALLSDGPGARFRIEVP